MKHILTIARKEWLYLMLIILILILFFNKILFFGEIFLPGDYLRSDTLHQNLPFKYTLYQSLKNGQLPLWTDEIFGGYPLLAEGQVGALYPFNFILYLLVPFVAAYNLSLFLNFLCAAIGMFMLTKSFKLESIPALISAITFSLSSFFILHITHQNIVSVACWFPFLLLMLKNFFETNKIRYAIFSSLIITIQIFAGSFQITFYSLVISLIFLIIYFYKKQLLAEVILKYFIIIAFGLFLSSGQLIPSIVLMSKSTRQSGIGNLALDSLPYHPRNLITFIFPYIYGDPGIGSYPYFGGSWGMFWDNTGYIGIFAFFIAVGSFLLINRKREVKALWTIAILSFLLALGKYGPLFWIFHLPFFNLFRVTGRFLLFSIFCLSVLAGFSIDAFSKEISQKFSRLVFNLFVIFIVTADLFLFGYNYNPTVKAEKVLEKPEMVRFLEKYPDKGKIFSVADDITYDEINKNGWRDNMEENLFHKNSLGPDLNMLWGVKSVSGYSGLFLKDYEEVKSQIYQGIELKENKIYISEDSLKLLGEKQARFLISAFDLVGRGLEKIYEVGNGKTIYKLYKNNYFKGS